MDAGSLAGAMLHEGQLLIVKVESPDPLGPVAGCELPDPSRLTLLSPPVQVSWAPPSKQKSMMWWSSRLRTWPHAPTTSTLSGCPTGRHRRVSWAIAKCCKPLSITSCSATFLPGGSLSLHDPAICIPPTMADGYRDGLDTFTFSHIWLFL